MSNQATNDAARVVDAATKQVREAANGYASWSAQATLDGTRQMIEASTEATRWATDATVSGSDNAIRAVGDAAIWMTQAAADAGRRVLASWSSNTQPPLKTMLALQSSAIDSWQSLTEATVRNNSAVLQKAQTTLLRQVGSAVQDFQRSSGRVVEDAVRQGQSVASEINQRTVNGQ